MTLVLHFQTFSESLSSYNSFVRREKSAKLRLIKDERYARDTQRKEDYKIAACAGTRSLDRVTLLGMFERESIGFRLDDKRRMLYTIFGIAATILSHVYRRTVSTIDVASRYIHTRARITGSLTSVTEPAMRAQVRTAM